MTMRTLLLSQILALVLLATAAAADLDQALKTHVLPRVAAFAEATEVLDEQARSDCGPEGLRPAYHAAFDAWMGVSHLGFGPIEAQGRHLAIAFWPDEKAMVTRGLGRLIGEADPVVDTAEGFAEVSVAARGFFALERMLYDPRYLEQAETAYGCALTRALTRDLARMAREIAAEWPAHAALMQSAGAGGNARYLSDREPLSTLYTALLTGLEFTKDKRLGRPLGTLERPRPTRAEAHRSGRSLRNVVLSTDALVDLARALRGAPLPQTEAALETFTQAASRITHADFSDVEGLSARLKVEVLQQRLAHLGDMIEAEVGGPMGLSAGFNASDGD